QQEVARRRGDLPGEPEHIQVAGRVVLELPLDVEVPRSHCVEPACPLTEQAEVAVEADPRREDQADDQPAREQGDEPEGRVQRAGGPGQSRALTRPEVTSLRAAAGDGSYTSTW